MATMIEAEMLARWKGLPGHPALRGVKRRTRGGGRTVGPAPASSVYVDDYANSASNAVWTQEIIEVSAEIFRQVGVVEKELKREGPAQALALLGMIFLLRQPGAVDPGAQGQGAATASRFATVQGRLEAVGVVPRAGIDGW
eukprot:3429401-Rhodomonas_salina.2